MTAAGCGEESVQVLQDASIPDAEVPYVGCFTTGAWSAEAYEGAPYISASMYGTVNGQEVGRVQQIRLRASHEFSIDSFPTDVRGAQTASSWMWHTRCKNGVDYYSTWDTTTAHVYSPSGCGNQVEALYYRLRVRAGNDAAACDPDPDAGP